MSDILVSIIILVILIGAIYKLYWDKKNNTKCSGCSTCLLNNKCHSVELKKICITSTLEVVENHVD